MHTVYTFLQTHLKSIVTVGFIIGLILLIIKFLDERLPQESKDRFNSWVDGLAIRLDDLRLPVMYQWVRAHKSLYLSCFITLYLGLFLLFIGHHIYESTKKVSLWDWLMREDGLHVFVILLIVSGSIGMANWLNVMLPHSLSESSASESTSSFWSKALRVVFRQGIIVAIVLAALRLLYECGVWAHFFYPPVKIPWIFFVVSLFVLPAMYLSAALILFLPLLLLVLLRWPIAAMSKAVWWLVNYPKGAWSGLVFALTTLLGIVRLFI